MLSTDVLLESQRPDGGWAYGRDSSGTWTEPTCYALLALAAAGQQNSAAANRAARWLAGEQRPDGGFAPRASVSESTWQTALVLMLPAELITSIDRARAELWLLNQTGRESGFFNRLRLLLAGVKDDTDLSFDGWPWYPGAAAWVTPTAVSILALEKMARGAVEPQVRQRMGTRINEGRAFLLARRCRDGGWNHGSTKALGYDSDSYPETTGTALLALNGVSGSPVERSLRLAEQHLAQCKSHEAAGWLTLGLLAHGRKPVRPDIPFHGETLAIAIGMLADAALDGRNVFLS